MKTQNYEKPKIKVVSLQNENAVANTCWGYHGTNTRLYCDLEGEGYASFQIGSGSCTLNLVNVRYYCSKYPYDENADSNGNHGGIPMLDYDDSNTANVHEGKVLLNKLNQKLLESGGSTGNPYKGEGQTVIPDNPSSSWS